MTLEWFGYIAAICTTVSFIPQVLHIIKTKDTQAISLSMYTIFTFGVAMWLIYGIILNNLPMTIANGITFILALFILIYKIQQTFFQKK